MLKIDPESTQGKAKISALEKLIDLLSYTNVKRKGKTPPPADDAEVTVEETTTLDGDEGGDDGPVMSVAEMERHEEEEEAKPHVTLDLNRLRRGMGGDKKRKHLPE